MGMTRTRPIVARTLTVLGMLAGVVAMLPAVTVLFAALLLSHELRNVTDAITAKKGSVSSRV